MRSPDVRSPLSPGGRSGYDQGGGASSVQLQADHLLLRPASAAAVLQRICEDGQTEAHLGANVHVRDASGLWSLDSGLWTLVSGLWTLVSGLWTLVSGVWTLQMLNSCLFSEVVAG